VLNIFCEAEGENFEEAWGLLDEVLGDIWYLEEKELLGLSKQ
jgi:hypothetical protein